MRRVVPMSGGVWMGRCSRLAFGRRLTLLSPRYEEEDPVDGETRQQLVAR